MSIQESLNTLHQTIKNFQNIVKSRIFNLGKFKITIIKPNNKLENTTLTYGLYFLRNTINELLNSKIKLKDFNILEKSIKRIFQKFIDNQELINFDKQGNTFKKLNENTSISLFKPLFCDLFLKNIKMDVFNDNCNELKESIRNFNSYKEKYREFYCKLQIFENLREKFERIQNILKSESIKEINNLNVDDFRLFRSFFPLNINSEYVIDIKNNSIIKI